MFNYKKRCSIISDDLILIFYCILDRLGHHRKRSENAIEKIVEILETESPSPKEGTIFERKKFKGEVK